MIPAVYPGMETSRVPLPVIDTVLVVDDEPEIARMVQMMLTDAGLMTHIAANGAVALQYIHERGMPRLLLVDLQMPVMDGPTFIAALRARYSIHAPIMILSAALDIEPVAARLRAHGFLAKPFNAGELKSKVMEILQQTA